MRTALRGLLVAGSLAALSLPIAVRAQDVPASIVGSWKVVRWTAPGIHTTDTKAAETWLGKRARFEAALAQFDAERCDQPHYVRKAVVAGEWFLDGFRLQSRLLGFAQDEKITIVEVACGKADRDWLAPGSLLIIRNERQIVTVWDGVFFELVRP